MTKRGIHKIENLVKLGRADVHIHSNYSDGRPTIKEILDYVQNHTDLDVIAICDHDMIEGALEAQELMKQGDYRFDLIIGEEITSDKGHIVGLYLKEKIKPGMSARKTVEAIHDQNGLAIASHPFERTRFHNQNIPVMNGIGMKALLQIGGIIDGMEIVNATPSLADENYRASLINKTVIFAAETGSSDAHILEAIGMGYTLFERTKPARHASQQGVAGRAAKDFYKALKLHQTRGMYANWTVLALLKYLFFFIPVGFRILINTIINGRVKYED